MLGAKTVFLRSNGIGTESQRSHCGRKNTKCPTFYLQRKSESGCEYKTWWNKKTCKSKVQDENGTVGTKDAGKYVKVYKKARPKGNDVKRTTSKPTNLKQPAIELDLLNWTKIPKLPEAEEFVSILSRHRCRKIVYTDTERNQSETHVLERMVFAAPMTGKLLRCPEKPIAQTATSMQSFCKWIFPNSKEVAWVLFGVPELRNRLKHLDLKNLTQ